MKRRLFALFLALVTVLQPVLPAAAESLEPEAETTAYVTEEAEETAAVPAETAPAPAETTEEAAEPTEMATEETETVTETTAETEETLLPAEEPTGEASEPVEAAMLEIVLPEGAAALRVGDSCNLQAVQTPAPEAEPEYIWQSSAPEVASVTQTGLLTALTEGETVITVSTVGESGPLTGQLTVHILLEKPFQGEGTQENPYILLTALDLEALASLVNRGEAGYAQASYVLGADVQLGEHTPIGTEEKPFRGRFDGSGYRITGLTGGDGGYWGLFGVAEGAELTGISLELVSLSGVPGLTAGAIAGLLRGSRLERSYAAGTMDANEQSCLLGGLVGRAENSTLSDVFAQMTILGYACAGGLAAQAEGTAFENAYTVGEIGCANGDDFDALVGKVGTGVSFDNCYQIDLPGECGQFLTVQEASQGGFHGLNPEIWQDGPEAYPYPVLADCPYTGSGYEMPDTGDHATGYIPEGEPANLPKSYSYSINRGSYPSKYTTPNLPAVRDQDPFNTCWAHSSVAGAEISLIKKGLASKSINLSEAQLAWFHHKGTKNDSGKYEDPLNNFGGDHNELLKSTSAFEGDNYFLASYSLASWIGLMQEDSKTQYTESTIKNIDRNGLPYAYAFSKDAAVLENVRMFPMNSGTSVIKQAILDYGGVGMNYKHSSGYYTSGGKFYYSSTVEGTDHAVIIVGWDDTISKSYFKDSINGTTPSRNGAWIVRNSWGSSFGSNGYFFMSYDTSFVSSPKCAGFVWDYTLAKADSYLYQYDGSECPYTGTIDAKTATYANVFTAQGDEKLEAVSFWMSDMADVNYRIDVYTNTTSGNPASGTLEATASGKTGMAGYYTVNLNTPVLIPKGTRFSLVVTLSGKSGYSIPIDKSVSINGWTRAVSCAKAGQSYLLLNGTWADCGSGSNGFNLRIKGRVTRLKEPIGEPCGDSMTYYIQDGTLTIKGSGDMWKYSAEKPAPWYAKRAQIQKVNLADSRIKTVSAYAFYNLTNLKSVKFPSGCDQMMLGDSCFEGSGLTSIELPPKVWIGNNIFKNCKNLTSIRFAEDETSIPRGAAYGCTSLTSVYLPDGCTTICSSAFSGCDKLTTIKLPKDLKTIEDGAFFHCAGLQEITLPTKQLTKIGGEAFCGTGIREIRIPETVTQWDNTNGAFQYCEKLETAYLPDSMINVPNGIFKGCSSLSAVQFGNQVKTIGSSAFQETAFTELTLPDTITFIGSRAFYYAQNLKRVELPDKLKSMYGEAFAGCIRLERIVLPATLTDIWSTTFVRCNALKEIGFAHGAAATLKIGDGAFQADNPGTATKILVGNPNNVNPAISGYDWAGSNRTVTYEAVTGIRPNTITAASLYVFGDDTKAQTVALNASALGGAALSYRSDNPSVTVSPEGIATVAKGFRGVAEITITSEATFLYQQTSKVITLTVSGAGGTFENLTWKLDDEGTLTISGSGEMEHVSPYPWEAYQGTVRKLIVKTGVTSIGHYAFDTFPVLTEVQLPDTLTAIEDNAFYQCAGLKSVHIPKSVTYFSERAFMLCEGLQNYFVDSGNGSYCAVDGVLYNKQKDTVVCFPMGRTGTYAIPDGVKTIGTEAFFGSKLSEVTFPGSLLAIGKWSFANSKISKLEIPKAVTDIAESAFTTCLNLKDVSIPGNVRTVGKKAFHGCIGLERLSLAEGVTTLGEMAFLGCKALTKADIPGTVTAIGQYALGYNETYRLDVYEKTANFTIFGVPGSAAQRYADSNGFPFKGSSTITYDANGGTGAPAPTEKNRGSTAYLSSTRPAKVGYQFTGWAESPDAATAQYQPGGSYTKDEDITLYAVWKANTYSIRFYANDGTQASVTQNSLKYDAAYTLRANTFQRTGYVFLGWAKTANGQVIYTDQAEIQNLTQTNNATVALYAQWQANRYQVRFDLNGGSGTVNPISAEYGKAYSLPSAAPARAGYTLSGWNTKADGKGTGYALDAQISNLTAEDGGSVTLYAVWKANTYSIRYYANDGTQSSVIQPDLNYGAQYALRANSFTWKGRVFLGWAETADGAVQYTNSEKVQNLTAENGAVVKLYAQWRLVTYQVRFDANGGVGTLQGIRVTYGDAFRLPEADALTRELYSFSGWTAVIGGVTKTYQPGTELRDVTAQDGEVITFKAVWTPNFGTIGTVEWVLDSGVLTISGTGRVPDYSSTRATPWAKAQVSSVQIGEGITYVGSYAFSGCASLTAVSLPASLQGIGVNAFRDCGSSLRYTYAGTLAQWGDISFAAADDPTASGVVLYESGKYMNGTCGEAMWKLQSDGTLRISGTGAAKAPAAGTGWAAEDVQSLVVEEGITEIGGSLFRGYSAIKTAALPRSLQTVGANAFSGCNALTTVRYSGKQEQWDAVSVGSGNEALTGARLLLSTYLIAYVNVEGAQNPNPDVADKDKALTLKNASKTGYTFGGWYREASFQTKVTSIPAGNEEDVTLYAKWTPIRYTVNFDANGGDGSPSQTSVSYDEALTLPGGSFSRTGYVLTGWNTAQDGTGTAYESSQEVVNLLSVQGASETLYAQWRPITYRVEFDPRGGEGQIDAITVQYDESFTMPASNSLRKTGYRLYWWFDNPEYSYRGARYSPNATVKNLTTEDGATLVFYAYWSPISYYVRFFANNGTYEADLQSSFIYDTPKRLNPNAFQWKGYTFAGWSTRPEGPVEYADEAEVVNLTTESGVYFDLYAQWVPTTYYLNLDANGGTGAPEKVTMHYGSSYTLPTEQDVRRPGYMLTGWKGKIGKSTKTYKPGAELRDLTTVEGEEFTLTAQWGPLKYTVRFEPGEGTGKIKTQAMTYGKLTALASNGFKRPGYVFAGWRGEDGTLYDDKEKVSDLTPEPNGVVVLTAQWKPNAYQLVFDPNGGTGELPGSGGLYTCGVTYRIPDSQPVRTGYRFLGWSTKAKGDVMYESGNSIRDLATVNGKTVTLYAVWAPKQYAILFGANGGSISVYPMFDQTCGKAVTLPSGSFTRPGYVFTGWNTKADGTGTAYKNKEKVTFCTDAAAVILYAQWQEIHYTVTYKNVALGSEGGNPTSYTMAEGLQLKDGFTRGMTFEGWYLDAKFNTPFDGFKPGDKNARNVTVYAKWSGYSDYFFVWYYKNAENPYTHVLDGLDKTLYYSQTYTLRANTFKRPGYRFLGWSRDPNAKVPEYTDKQKVGNLQPDAGAELNDISLYAIWEPIQYTITYKGVTQEEIQNLGNPETFTAADKISLKKPSRPGYRFDGWYTTAKFKGSSDTIDGSKSLKNLTLYAKWTNGNTKYTVTFNGNGAASGKNSIKALSFGQDLKLTNMSFKRTGYQFLGWSTDSKAKEPMYLVGQTVHDLTDKAETVTLYAVWEAIPYTVTLKNVTGANVPGVVEDTLTYTADGLTLPIPSREGAVFEGWYTTANFKSGTSVKRLLPGATGDLTLYAKWRIQ